MYEKLDKKMKRKLVHISIISFEKELEKKRAELTSLELIIAALREFQNVSRN